MTKALHFTTSPAFQITQTRTTRNQHTYTPLSCYNSSLKNDSASPLECEQQVGKRYCYTNRAEVHGTLAAPTTVYRASGPYLDTLSHLSSRPLIARVDNTPLPLSLHQLPTSLLHTQLDISVGRIV
ncbi:hypothetical protein E2C01_100558 [Portunus trituberculatus]|uniref:Uncharacterized protein n=1 Tax=Portunus trituberculatus TaxID=210409 RepID=A0A5B7KDV1_PORTR|nr:hypothetical protein [Portunus trituberculatus]